MRKLIGGNYVKVDAPARSGVETKVALATSGNAIKASAAARKLIEANPGVNFSALVGSGTGGQVTKPDVENYIEGLKK